MSTLLFAVSLGEESIVPTLKLNRMKFAEESHKDLWPIRQRQAMIEFSGETETERYIRM